MEDQRGNTLLDVPISNIISMLFLDNEIVIKINAKDIDAATGTVISSMTDNHLDIYENTQANIIYKWTFARKFISYDITNSYISIYNINNTVPLISFSKTILQAA